jgi:hypothetical protein
VDSSGLMFVWGAYQLHSMGGWKGTIKPLIRYRAVGPLLLTSKAGFDFMVSGWYWVNTRRWVEN